MSSNLFKNKITYKRFIKTHIYKQKLALNNIKG